MKVNNMDVLRPEQVSEDLESLVKALGTDENPSPIALDLETSGLKLHIDRIYMISWATKKESGVITVQHLERVGYQEASIREVIQPVLSNPRQTVIFHNAKFDLGMMVAHGWIEVHEIKARIFDTMLAQYLLGPVDKKEGHNYKLKDLAIRILQVDGDDVIDFEELTAKTRFPELPFAEVKVYSANDTFLTYKLYEVLTNQFFSKPHLLHYFTEIEMPHVLNTVEMETKGLGLGENPLESLIHQIGQCIEEEMEPRRNLLNLHNVRSRVQMFHFLDRIEAPIEHAERDRFTFKTKLTTTSFLQMLVKASGDRARHGLMNVIKLRGLFKEKQKYEEFLKFLNSRTNRLHASFNSFLSTGRYSASRPNILELSSKSRVRDVIKAKPGNVLVVADFSQIDLRVIANLAASAGGGELMKHVNDGYDLHLNTLRIICPLVRPDLFIDKTWKKIPEGDQYAPLKQLRKSLAKPINFGISYGLGAEGLAESLNNLDDLERNILKGKDIMECLNLHFQGSSNQYTKEDGDKFLRAFHGEYPEIKKFQAQAEKELLEKGYTVNPFGRECVPPIGRLVMTRTDLQFDVRFKWDSHELRLHDTTF